MFEVRGEQIIISRGDTGAVRFNIDTEYQFQDEYDGDPTHGDRALFTIKDLSGGIVKRKVTKITDNSYFDIYFLHKDTADMREAQYRWDVRFLLHPYYDDDGNVADADQWITPKQPMEVQTLDVVGEK